MASHFSYLALTLASCVSLQAQTTQTTGQASQQLTQVEKLAAMRKQAQQVIKRSAARHKRVLSGDEQLYATLQTKFATQFPRDLEKLANMPPAILKENNPHKKKHLVQAFQTALHPLGPYLQSSSYQKTDLSLSAAQAKELKQLERLHIEAMRDTSSNLTLKAVSRQHVYTMLHIPVYIDLKVPPHAEVFIKSNGGGEFPNGLSIQQLVADASGNINTYWVSRGDAVGMSVISVNCPTTNNTLTYEAEVVGLKLIELPKISEQAIELTR